MVELRPNRTKEKLAAGEIVTCLAGVDTPYLVDFVGQIGVDAVWLEAEHGPVSFEDVGNLSRAADLWGMTPIVRVGSTDYSTIYRTLDMRAFTTGALTVLTNIVCGTDLQADSFVRSSSTTQISCRVSSSIDFLQAVFRHEDEYAFTSSIIKLDAASISFI